MKTCKICQKEFAAIGNKKYCSDSCYNKHRNDERRSVPKIAKCQFCSVEFVQKRKDNITCSPVCSQRLWVKNNPEKNWERYNRLERKTKAKEWRSENIEKVKSIRKKYRNKKRLDFRYRLKENVSNLIRHSFKLKFKRKSERTEKILGCNVEEFRDYIQSKFEPWMNWNNYGLYNGTLNFGWDIDHIIPISLAKTEEDLYRINNYKNLQPLCSYTNRHIKSDNQQATN